MALQLVGIFLILVIGRFLTQQPHSTHIKIFNYFAKLIEEMKNIQTSKPDIERVLTVIMGSNGPKISSVMIAELSGGSTKIVGSMNLQFRFKYLFQESKIKIRIIFNSGLFVYLFNQWLKFIFENKNPRVLLISRSCGWD